METAASDKTLPDDAPMCDADIALATHGEHLFGLVNAHDDDDDDMNSDTADGGVPVPTGADLASASGGRQHHIEECDERSPGMN